jgi:hypothetical protein
VCIGGTVRYVVARKMMRRARMHQEGKARRKRNAIRSCTCIPWITEIFKTNATSYSDAASDWVTFTFVAPGFTFWCGGLPVAPGLVAFDPVLSESWR